MSKGFRTHEDDEFTPKQEKELDKLLRSVHSKGRSSRAQVRTFSDMSDAYDFIKDNEDSIDIVDLKHTQSGVRLDYYQR